MVCTLWSVCRYCGSKNYYNFVEDGEAITCHNCNFVFWIDKNNLSDATDETEPLQGRRFETEVDLEVGWANEEELETIGEKGPLVVARCDDEILGYISLHCFADWGLIGLLWVPGNDLQVCSSLFSFAEDVGRRKGWRYLDFYSENVKQTLLLYNSIGYEACNNAVHFRRDL